MGVLVLGAAVTVLIHRIVKKIFFNKNKKVSTLIDNNKILKIKESSLPNKIDKKRQKIKKRNRVKRN